MFYEVMFLPLIQRAGKKTIDLAGSAEFKMFPVLWWVLNSNFRGFIKTEASLSQENT